MPLSPVEIAVLNNIHWYEAMFEAHGIACETDDVAWQSHETPPPFHSNLVVRAREASQAEVEMRLRRIGSQPRPGGWGLKDSYANLDLASQGFLTLFNASWLWLAPEATPTHDKNADVIWSRVETPTGLAEWEHAWAGAPENISAMAASRQFPLVLLRNRDFAFLAGRRQGRIVAGGIVNRSPGAAGVSNFFTSALGPRSIWPALAQHAREVFPGLPLTGYSRGEELLQALQAGFTTVGDLRVLYQPATP